MSRVIVKTEGNVKSNYMCVCVCTRQRESGGGGGEGGCPGEVRWVTVTVAHGLWFSTLLGKAFLSAQDRDFLNS